MYRVTPQVTSLYNALMDRGIKCKLEDDSDGYKTVDISIPEAKINIEVDGLQHFTNPNQIYSDFDRSYWSYKKNNFDTFHIPNSIIDSHLEEVVNALTIVAKRCKQEIKENNSFWNWFKKLFR
ncbi:MAG TPA: hypothetical protein P5230_04360 [Candidatus Magasanikbacteria bacterium]|nr:hypothetical protein [Candidatus Magasanikbacteria bacterium]